MYPPLPNPPVKLRAGSPRAGGEGINARERELRHNACYSELTKEKWMATTHITTAWDHERLKQDRLALLQAEMQRQDIGALYLSDGPHVRYLLDLKVPGCRIFVPPEGDVV